MSFFSRPRQDRASTLADLGVAGRSGASRGAVSVTPDSSLRHSAVWASLRLRANLISTFPIDNYRDVGGIPVELPKPPVIVAPGGERWRYKEWMYASQFDLDRTGNTIGLITEVSAAKSALYPDGLPARIDLQAATSCTVIQRKGESRLTYRIDGKEYPQEKVWHERQYVISGLPVGLSPLAYAAWSIGEYLSIQQFALDWFGGGGVPKARLKNTAKKLDPKEAGIMKDRFRATVQNGDLFVTGNDWEYDMMQGTTMGMEWIDGRKYGVTDIARFFDVPGDLIEASVSGSAVTYASITQRNLQLLIMHLGPAVVRREDNLSTLLPMPRYVKLNTDALLRMDPETRAKVLAVRLASRQLAPSEARAFENLPPFTDAQIAEIERIYGPPKAQPAAGAPTPAVQAAEQPALPQVPPVRAIATVADSLPWAEGT